MTEFSGNSEDAVSVEDIKDLKGHGSSAVNGVHVAAGRAETGMATERDEFKVTAAGAGVHGTAKGGIAAMDHFFYIFDDRVTRMLKI